MKFEKGKQYECLRDYGTIFTKGVTYQCSKNGYLIDNDGDEIKITKIESVFKLHEPEPKLGEKVLVWDDDESKATERIFLAKVDGECPYLVFAIEEDYENFKLGNLFDCYAYKNMKPVQKVETVSLKEALSILEAHKGVKCRIEVCE